MPTKKTKTTKTKSEPRRRRPAPEPEPEFEEIELCAAPGCEAPAMPGSDYCLIHMGLDMALDKLQDGFRKSDVTGALMGAAGVLLFNNAPGLGRAINEAARRGGVGAPPPPPPRPAPRGAVDPFTVLGLDRARATPADVKRVQKALAKLYHADAAGAAVDPKRMAEINAAAAAALEHLRRAGK